MDRLSEMATFVEVARRGSFSAAARHLKQSPSAVSKLVTRMEERLGVRLFSRTTRQVSLTEAGSDFLQRCVSIVDDVDDAEEQLKSYSREPTGVLTINANIGFARYCLLPLLPAFQRTYPKLALNLQLSGTTVDLISEGVDVAIRMGELKETNLVARKLFECPRIICASPEYLKLRGVPGVVSDLNQHNCLRMSTSSAFNQWHLGRGRSQKVVDVRGDFITDQVDVLHLHALQGGGLVRLSEFMVANDIAAGRLVPVMENINHAVQTVHAVFPHRLHLPLKVRVFVDYLVESLS